MIYRYLTTIIALVVVTASFSVARADVVTAENISYFSEQRSNKGSFVCNGLNGKRRLGTLKSSSGAPSRIVPGAVFSPLTPTLKSQISKQQKAVNAALKLSKRKMAKKEKTAVLQRLRRAQVQLSMLANRSMWCDAFRPGQLPPDENPAWRELPKIPSASDILGNDDTAAGKTYECSTTVEGSVSNDRPAIVTLGNDNWLQSQEAKSGQFSFTDVPEGTYLLTAEKAGYAFGPAHTVVVRAGAQCTGIAFTGRVLKTAGVYAYQWRQRGVLRSVSERATIIESAPVGQSTMSTLTSSDGGSYNISSGAAFDLNTKYNVTLDSRELAWGTEYAQRLLIAFNGLFNSFDEKPSVWILTKEYLDRDIEFTESDDVIQVRVTADAFRYAASEQAAFEGSKGDIGSFRLSTAVLRFSSRNGRNSGMIQQILMQKFGIWVKDEPPVAEALARNTTREPASSFQRFTGEELIAVTAAIANLPRTESLLGMPLAIVRRSNGVPNPVYGNYFAVIPQSGYRPGLAPTGEPYLEYTQDAFRLLEEPQSDLKGTLPGSSLHPSLEPLLLGTLSAYAGIVWDRGPSRELVSDWISLGGWTFDDVREEWRSSDPTQVGSMLSYGRALYGPSGDFATSLAQYIAAPNELAFRSPARYEFIKTKIMRGLRYARAFRDDLKFPVYNPRPDLSMPGEVKEISAVITGTGNQTKYYRMDLALEGDDPMLSGASYGWLELYFPQDDTKDDKSDDLRIYVPFRPLKPDPVYGASTRLQARGVLSSFQPGGYYELRRVYLIDSAGNMRIQNNDFGFGFYLDSELRPQKPANVVPGSTQMSLTETEVEGVIVPAFKVQFQVADVERLKGVGLSVTAISKTLGNFVSTNARNFTLDGNLVTMLLPVSPHIQSGVYGLSHVKLDSEEQSKTTYFVRMEGFQYSKKYERMPLVTINNDKEDLLQPLVDLNNIKVDASPSNPANPNGETGIVVTMRAKDDLSGIRFMQFCLRDPLDRSRCNPMRLENRSAVLPEGTTEWRDIKGYMQLPAGSVPGIWGLDFIYIVDKAGNSRSYTLSEIVKIPVQNNS